MRAFAIFDGGGVKGAVFAGCLHAAEDFGIKFQGFGGTSAGSLIALLGSLGYSGEKIKEISINTDFSEFLDDGGVKLNQMLVTFPENVNYFNGHFYALRHLNSLKGIVQNLGLYHGQNLEKFLLEKIHEKIPELESNSEIRFTDLQQHDCKPLKVLASSVSYRQPFIFSHEGTHERNINVIDAVRASVCFPFVFQPVKFGNNYLVDGGLTSNLPIFLFEDEKKEQGIPIIAFDLVTKAEANPEIYNLKHLIRDMISTSLESSEEVVQKLVNDVYYIQIPIPPDIGTLAFGITKSKREDLYNLGYRVTAQYLNKNLEHWKQVQTPVEELQLRYAPEPQVKRILYALLRDVELCSSVTLEDLRAFVYIRTPQGRRKVIYQVGMDGDTDAELELEIEEGGSGLAWTSRRQLAVEVNNTNNQMGYLGEDAAKRIRKDRKAMYAAPIFKTTLNKADVDPDYLIGVVCVDSSIELDDTAWTSSARDDMYETFDKWALVLSNLMK